MHSTKLPHKHTLSSAKMSQEMRFEAIGTRWHIQYDLPSPGVKHASIARAIRQRIALFDKTYSRFRSDSFVSTIAGKAGTYAMPDDGARLVRFYDELYHATDGRVTPLIGQVMSDAGYDAAYSLRPGTLSVPPAWRDVISYDEKHLTLTRPALLDVGAAGKGYLVDLLGEVLNGFGVSEYVINAGGDILQRSAAGKPLAVGLEDPANPDEIIGVTYILNESLCASAGQKRRWDKFTHIIDPTTLTSPSTTMASWVIAPTAMVADGIATALFFVPALQLTDIFTFTYARLDSDMILERADTFTIREDGVSA